VSDLFGKDGAEEVVSRVLGVFELLKLLDIDSKVDAINKIRLALHQISPFAGEPVDYVQWVKSDLVRANDYNPNSVAPPEMKLLEHSVTEDGYTQPIVAWTVDGMYEVVDGFHRNRVGKESKKVRARVHGYLPVTVANQDRTDITDRMASTIRHNRARGKHKVEAMSDIVIELKRRNWSDDKIGRELGMDADEVLRLCQITGMAEVFKDQQFSQAWEIDKTESEVLLNDEIEPRDTGDRIYHTWDKWECYRAGFYAEKPKNMTQDEGEEKYQAFLSDLKAFEAALEKVTGEWKFSCEHYLTNERMNRIAWLGQSSVAYSLGIPAVCRGGYNRLDEEQKYQADQMALKWLNRWLVKSGRKQLMLADVQPKTEADLY
jgi:ParB-like chromosome segregation protein Spo0J